MSMSTPRPAVFVDRDNTLIRDPGYLRDVGRVELLPGVAEALRRLRAAGYPVVVVSNQSGVARGYLSEQEVDAIHDRMRGLLAGHGAGVDAIYYCPYFDGPEAIRTEYRIDSDLRKPKPGMLLLAARDHAIDLSRSWMIGDSERDVQAGRAAGCRTILLSSNGQAHGVLADHVAPDLATAVERILNPPLPQAQRPGADTPPTAGSSVTAPLEDGTKETLQEILDELKRMRRDQQFGEFSLGHLAGAIAQAFAICAIGWGLYAAINGADSAALIRLAAGIAFQLIALTWFAAASKR
jgi:D-glycero-D-manno-heptose 1,7-bisphosphate phosphatase